MSGSDGLPVALREADVASAACSLLYTGYLSLKARAFSTTRLCARECVSGCFGKGALRAFEAANEEGFARCDGGSCGGGEGEEWLSLVISDNRDFRSDSLDRNKPALLLLLLVPVLEAFDMGRWTGRLLGCERGRSLSGSADW